MTEDDREQDGPSLKAPSLGFGRKRRPKASANTPDAETTSAIPADDAPTTNFGAEGGAPLFADELEPAPASIAENPTPDLMDVATDDPTDDPTGATKVTEVTKPPRESRAPLINGLTATVITGLLIGALMVGLTAASLRLCESVRGTSSCGNPGFLLLVAILIATVVLGSALLRFWRVPDPGSTSFLAVGLLAVLTLLFLVDVLANWWMIIVIPLLSALTFVLSYWVTTTLAAPAED